MKRVYRIDEDYGSEYTLSTVEADGKSSDHNLTTPYGTVYESLKHTTQGKIEAVVPAGILEDVTVVRIGNGYLSEAFAEKHPALVQAWLNQAA